MVAERIRGPQIGARSRFAYLKQRVRDIYEFRYLVRYLASATLRLDRVSFVFGFLWWLLDPLLMIVLWTIVLVVILGRGKGLHYPYPLFLMSAMLPWQYMVRTARNGTFNTRSKELHMRDIAFPRAVIPLAIGVAEAVKLLLALALFPVVAVLFGQPLSPVQLLVVPFTLLLVVISVGIGWFLAALNFVFRDTERLLGVVFRLWLFLSPVLYAVRGPDARHLPARFERIYELNPMTLILECFRSVLLYHQIPGLTTVGGTVLMAVACASVGFVFFHHHEPRFARLN